MYTYMYIYDIISCIHTHTYMIQYHVYTAYTYTYDRYIYIYDNISSLPPAAAETHSRPAAQKKKAWSKYNVGQQAGEGRREGGREGEW